MSVHGKFVWHDLMTPKPEDAKRFYGELFGWRIWKGEHGEYLHISVGERDIGGIMEAKPPQPTAWLAYVAADKVDDAVARATAAGGRVFVPPTDIPHVGRFAVVADPRGAVYAPFQSLHGIPDEERTPGNGEFCWDELLTDDPQASLAFHEKVWGWTHDAMEMPGFGTYHVLKRGTHNVGGLMKSPPGGPPMAYWLSYVAVASTDDTVARAKKLGGAVHAPPMDIPNVGRFAVLADNTGATFAILQPAR